MAISISIGPIQLSYLTLSFKFVLYFGDRGSTEQRSGDSRKNDYEKTGWQIGEQGQHR